MKLNLYDKYTTRTARYKSYPAVPFWCEENRMQEEWETILKKAIRSTNDILLHVHLPFCESLCTFCAFSPHITNNHSHEKTYIDHLLKEWLLYLDAFKAKPLIKHLHIGGGTPSFFSPYNISKIISFIKKSATILPNAEFSFEVSTKLTSIEHLYTLKSLGVKTLILGIQDFDIGVQKTINKQQSFEEVYDFIEACRIIRFETISIDLAFGLPNQTRKSIINTIYKIKELQPERVTLYEYLHHPEKCPAQKSIESKIPLTPETTNLYVLSKQMLKEIGYIEIGMDRFVLPSESLYAAYINNEISYNKLGPSTQNTPVAIGLGLGAISDGWFAFTKNSDNLKKYYSLIQNKKLPIEKGNLLSKQDLIIRKHIINLQTHHKTSWEKEEDWHPILSNALERLNRFEKDRLLKITETGIKIRKNGKYFIRDICNAFDERLWK